MTSLLSQIESPLDLQGLSEEQLRELAQEMRDELVRVLSIRPAHFASNLGVVELCLALHLSFDFRKDRLIWDTGHQIYPHKLITGRYQQFETIRTQGGLMGYPNPSESEYDLFMTGHAGCSVSTALGLKVGDELQGRKNTHSVAVIGDGALPSGIVFEAFNNAGGLDRPLIVILNDNQMSICPRVGALASCLDQARVTRIYKGGKRKIRNLLSKIPLIGGKARKALEQLRDGLKAVLTGGMLFEELGFKYFGPIDGHDLPTLRHWLKEIKKIKEPVLLHVLTRKGEGVPQASADPVTYHTPPIIDKIGPNRTILSLKRNNARAYTDAFSQAIHQAMARDKRVSVITAAMCQGNKLEKVRNDFPDRFFDVGICESHAVAFAAGLAKTGNRPIVDIYSTFLQRSFDQLFQEVALQNLPVVFTMDRAGLTGPDGPTHHGAFDIPYTRIFPNFVVMAPGDESEVVPMLQFALQASQPVTLRYPKANVETVTRNPQPIELGKAEVIRTGEDATLIACGTLLTTCVKAADQLKNEGIRVGVINARFIKPLDEQTLLHAITTTPLVVTVEEGCLEGGFGSALLECANQAGMNTGHLIRLGLPNRFIEHGERKDLLADLKLDVAGLCGTIHQALRKIESETAIARIR